MKHTNWRHKSKNFRFLSTDKTVEAVAKAEWKQNKTKLQELHETKENRKRQVQSFQFRAELQTFASNLRMQGVSWNTPVCITANVFKQIYRMKHPAGHAGTRARKTFFLTEDPQLKD